MIPGDIAVVLGVRASGTWRPAPPGANGTAGTYATSLPFLMAGPAGRKPGEVAAGLAATLLRQPWICAATVTGGGFLTVTVTHQALAALAIRVPTVGAACAASDALRGTERSAPADSGLASAATWDAAWRLVAAGVTSRLAATAGALVTGQPALVTGQPASVTGQPASVTGQPASVTGQPDTTAQRLGPVPLAAAIRFAGMDAIRYALARTSAGRAGAIDVRRCVRNDLLNPFFTVRYAHAHAASVLRWATDLGVDRGDPGEFRPGLLAHPSERELLGIISWMPERAASAARRQRADAFTRYLESLASAWLNCRESCPALPFGGRSAPSDGAGRAARLWLAAAAQTALGTGLRLLGVAAPTRL